MTAHWVLWTSNKPFFSCRILLSNGVFRHTGCCEMIQVQLLISIERSFPNSSKSFLKVGFRHFANPASVSVVTTGACTEIWVQLIKVPLPLWWLLMKVLFLLQVFFFQISKQRNWGGSSRLGGCTFYQNLWGIYDFNFGNDFKASFGFDAFQHKQTFFIPNSFFHFPLNTSWIQTDSFGFRWNSKICHPTRLQHTRKKNFQNFGWFFHIETRACEILSVFQIWSEVKQKFKATSCEHCSLSNDREASFCLLFQLRIPQTDTSCINCNYVRISTFYGHRSTY